jgi:hypothetical protein
VGGGQDQEPRLNDDREVWGCDIGKNRIYGWRRAEVAILYLAQGGARHRFTFKRFGVRDDDDRHAETRPERTPTFPTGTVFEAGGCESRHT